MSIDKLKGGKINIHLWAPINEVESEALDQLKNVAKLHVAVMPDCHACAKALYLQPTACWSATR